MEVRYLARSAMVGATAVALATSAASSQGVTYSNWTFNQSLCAGSSCSFDGYDLHWSWVTGSTYLLTITQNGFGQGGDQNFGGDQNSGGNQNSGGASSNDPG